jgi:hypothetical protein
VPLGYWEAKDEDDDLDVEIAKKLRRGYPQDNIIFEDSREAVLIQNRHQVLRCSVTDGPELLRLLNLFFGYERQEIADFRKAVKQFQRDMPAVLEALREKIADAYKTNKSFTAKAAEFLDHARKTINPTVSDADIREMLIQHILTEEIFAHVFNDSDFHRHNNIASRLYALEDEFFKGPVKRQTLHSIEPYYATIRSTAALITSHTEKQQFLKVIYENFYKIYDKKKADRLGVVYTPNEIVRFIIEGADWLAHKHFGKGLIDRGVEILDPSAGTGTFICELLEHFRGQPAKMAWKYTNELHANEVAILSYYVANLNIEATYAALAKTYIEFPALCFVGTLDNISGLGIRSRQQLDLLAGLSDENVERVRRQNRAKISVVIGNPPYNANQQNENDNNKNRTYPHIDELIKQTYVKQSTAQKTKQYPSSTAVLFKYLNRRDNLRRFGSVALHSTFWRWVQAAVIACTVGGSATPAARSARLAAGRGGARSKKRLASCSTSVSVSVSRSAMVAGHDPSRPRASIRASSSALSTRAKRLQNTWPRMVSSSLWKIGRVVSRCLAVRKICSTVQSCL